MKRRQKPFIFRPAGALLGSLLLLFLCLGTFGFSSARAAEGSVKLYTSATVGFGESFREVLEGYYSEAEYRNFREYEDEVLRINNLIRIGEEVYPAITPGDAVIVPYFAAP